MARVLTGSFSGLNGAGAISIPTIKAGDRVIAVDVSGGGNASALAGVVIALLAWSLPASAESAPKKFLSTAGLNPNLVMAGTTTGNVTGGAVLKTLVGSNSTATVYFLKLYNKATAPVCGTDTPLQTIMLPAGQTVPIDYGLGQIYPAGLGFCLTAAIADNDTGPAAAGVAINFGVSGR